MNLKKDEPNLNKYYCLAGHERSVFEKPCLTCNPTDLTPDEVIAKVCAWLISESDPYKQSRERVSVAREIQSNKSKILGIEVKK